MTDGRIDLCFFLLCFISKQKRHKIWSRHFYLFNTCGLLEPSQLNFNNICIFLKCVSVCLSSSSSHSHFIGSEDIEIQAVPNIETLDRFGNSGWCDLNIDDGWRCLMKCEITCLLAEMDVEREEAGQDESMLGDTKNSGSWWVLFLLLHKLSGKSIWHQSRSVRFFSQLYKSRFIVRNFTCTRIHAWFQRFMNHIVSL